MKNWSSCLGLLLGAAVVNAAPAPNPDFISEITSLLVSPKVEIQHPKGLIIGTPGEVETFASVPFAKPPVGSRRLRPPEPITEPLGEYSATKEPFLCPQLVTSVNEEPELTELLGKFVDAGEFQKAAGISEDCLYLSIFRPKGTKAGDKLPVLYWIFGGGFELGWSSMYSPAGVPWVSASIQQGEPIIFVMVNYRVAGFGFLPGKEIKEDGAGNLGLRDQRLGMEWVADNIEAFGGDPDRVTIWGESAGAISICDQAVMYGGNNTYKGKPLFHGAIMNSGSVVPANDIAGGKGQQVYDSVVKAGGCSGKEDTLNCLRDLDYETFLNATNSVPAILSYTSVALSYIPRPDGSSLPESPDALALAGKYTHVPMIIGDQEDEGTLFAIMQFNLTTKEDVVEYLQKYFFWNMTTDLMNEYVSYYDNDWTDGSPFRTGDMYRIYPQFKRLAAILGDLVFTLTRRVTLQILERMDPEMPTWSYLSSYDQGTPLLGTPHGSDLIQVVYGIKPNYAAQSFKQYYISFVNHYDPNKGVTDPRFIRWPQYSQGHQLLHTLAGYADYIPDDFRKPASDFITKHIRDFYF